MSLNRRRLVTAVFCTVKHASLHGKPVFGKNIYYVALKKFFSHQVFWCSYAHFNIQFNKQGTVAL